MLIANKLDYRREIFDLVKRFYLVTMFNHFHPTFPKCGRTLTVEFGNLSGEQMFNEHIAVRYFSVIWVVKYIYDPHKYPISNNRDHLVGRLSYV